MPYTMSVGRDYRTNSSYEYCIYLNEQIVARQGFFKTSTQAKRAGLRAAEALPEPDPRHLLDGVEESGR